MRETMRFLEKARERAREIDLSLIDNKRGAVIGRNLRQITGINRSEKYVGRLAGISADVKRNSVSEQNVIWYGGAAIENAVLANQLKDFWNDFLSFPDTAKTRKLRDFWLVREEASAVLASVPRTWAANDLQKTRFFLVQLQESVREMLEICNAKYYEQ